MLDDTQPYSPPNHAEISVANRVDGCFILACVVLVVSTSLLALSIWFLALVDYSQIRKSDGGANIGVGVAIIGIGMFAISGVAIALTAFYLYSRRARQSTQPSVGNDAVAAK